jgi:opacity protein-like surface antigen
MSRVGVLAATAAVFLLGGASIASASPLVYDWSGVYFGIGAGYATGSTTVTPTGMPDYSEQPMSPTGGLANLEIDVEKQVNHAVFGIAGDVSLGKFHGDSTWSETSPGEEATSPWTSDTGLLASLRARAGISFGAFLPYVTGGLAYQSTDVVWNYELNPPNLPDLPTSNTHLNSLGWVIGAGLQVALSQGWSLQGEYDFSSFGNVTDPNIPFDDEGPVLGGTINNNISVVKFSLKHKFGP